MSISKSSKLSHRWHSYHNEFSRQQMTHFTNLDYPEGGGLCWDRLAVRHRDVSADLLRNLDTFCHLLVLTLVLRNLLTHFLCFVFANLLGNLLAVVARGAVAGLVGGSALLLVNCFANFLLVIFANIVVDGLALLLQLFFTFYIFSFSALCLYNVLTNVLDVIHTLLHLNFLRIRKDDKPNFVFKLSTPCMSCSHIRKVDPQRIQHSSEKRNIR